MNRFFTLDGVDEQYLLKIDTEAIPKSFFPARRM